MTRQRWVLVATGVVVTIGAVVFVIAGWSRLGALAASIGALATLAGVGITAWATITRSSSGTRRIEVTRSGPIHGATGSAVTGAAIRDGSHPDEVIVRQTGSIDGGRDGVTGFQSGS